jgi:spore germination protein KB
MNIEESKISASQLMISIAAFVQGSTLILSFMDSIAYHDAWLVTLSGFIVSIPFVLSYAALSKRFPAKNFIQIIDIIYGPYLGKLISTLYIVFFFLLFAFNLRDLAVFYIGFIMPDTPMAVFLIMFALACAFAVRNGIEVIAKISFPVIAYIIFFVLILSVLLLKDAHISNFLPVFEIPLKVYIQGTHIMVSVLFGEIVVFLMVMPSLNDYKKIGKYTVGGLVIAALSLIIISVRNTAVLGPSSSILVNSSYQAVRLIDIGNILTRVELLVAVGITLTLYTKICILYYATVTGISKLLRLHSYLPLILPIGSIAVITALIAFESSVEHAYWGSKYAMFFSTPFIIIPPLSLMISQIRRLPEKMGDES